MATAKIKKPTLKKLPRPPKASEPIAKWEKWEKDCSAIARENEKTLKPYNDAIKAKEQAKKKGTTEKERKAKLLTKVKGFSGFGGFRKAAKKK